MPARTELKDRFWKYVRPRPDDCFLWCGAKRAGGYGQVRDRTRTLKAHRVAWELTFGVIDGNLSVLHHCDNPSCVNPDHLFLGTQADNMADCAAKGRARNRPRRGEANNTTKLRETDVLEIRRLHDEAGLGFRALARRFGMNKKTISQIVRRLIWRHLP